MKAIIIEEKDANALLESLKLCTFEGYGEREAEIFGISKEGREAITREIHAAFHYRVVRWLQEQGASCVH